MRAAGRLILVLLFICVSFDIVESGDIVSIKGYYKNFFAVYDPPRIEIAGDSFNDPEKGVVINRLRLDLSRKMTRWMYLNVSYSIAPRIQDNSLFYSDQLITELNQFDYRIADLDSRIYPSEDDTVGSFAVFHNLDRLYFSLKAPDFDIYMGRQAIAWGSARAINPTDIFAPYKFEELDTEERIGVDAVRARVPLGVLSELDAGLVLGEDAKYKNSAAFIRSKFYTMKTDISVLLIGFRENMLAGLDMASSWGGAGIWLEAAYVWPGALNEGMDEVSDKEYMAISLGSDYSFGDKTYSFIEYHFNQAGSTNSDDYLNQFSETAYTEGSVYLLGEHYLIPGVTYQITPLITYNGQVLTNLNDPSAFIYSTLEYNIAPSIYLSAGFFVGIGKSPRLTALPGLIPELNSEFGTYPDIYFTSFSIYF